MMAAFFQQYGTINYNENQLITILKVHTRAIGVGIVTVKFAPRSVEMLHSPLKSRESGGRGFN